MRLRGWAVALAVVVLCLLWWSMRPSTQVSTGSGPSPAESWAARRGVAAASPPTPSEPTPDQEEDEDEEVSASAIVVVYLREAGEGFLAVHRTTRFDVEQFWPLPGEAPFPNGGTAEGLQDLISDVPRHDSPRVAEWLDLAWSEGLDPAEVSVEDPWAGVLALEVARRAARLDQREAYAAALRAGEGPQNGAITMDALVGPPDVAEQIALAEDLVDAWPEHPAAEYARLYRLDAVVTGKLDEEGRAVALDLLRHSDDALVVGQAVDLLRTRPRGELLEGADLDRLLWFAQDFPELGNAVELAAFALDQALAREDGRRARAWLGHYSGIVDEMCAAERHTYAGSSCGVHQDNRDVAVAYVGDVVPSQAETWRQAFEIAGYHCARQGHDPRIAPIRTRAHWDGGWAWEPWDRGPSGFGACFVEAASAGPAPRVGQLEVHVAVLR
ncbi:MAG: hypothetical protein KTR31_07905 [Myxococcales bacterium]|nr:hypothetical protein [Myxococcales bacterium]